tara:strand:- start:872 stop:1450 length:579 start_codon:yes stop_codon:yes gene_type:complete
MNKIIKFACILLVIIFGTSCAQSTPPTLPPSSAAQMKIKWNKYEFRHDFLRDYGEHLQDTKSDKHILLYVTSNHCPACEYFNKTTLSSVRVVPVINESYEAIKLNVDDIPKDDPEFRKTLIKQLNIKYLPMVIIYTDNGTSYKEVARIIGAISKFEFLTILRTVNSLNIRSNKLKSFKLHPIIIETFNKSKI